MCPLLMIQIQIYASEVLMFVYGGSSDLHEQCLGCPEKDRLGYIQ